MGQGLNSSHSCDLHCSWSNARSFNPMHRTGNPTCTLATTQATTVRFLTHCAMAGTPISVPLTLSLLQSSGLKIQCCCSCGWDLIPGLGTSTHRGCGQKRKKKERKKKSAFDCTNLVRLAHCLLFPKVDLYKFLLSTWKDTCGVGLPSIFFLLPMVVSTPVCFIRVLPPWPQRL